MTDIYLSKEKKMVEALMDRVENKLSTTPQKTAYNYLFDYTEGLWMMTFEGERLLGLCVEVLEEIDSNITSSDPVAFFDEEGEEIVKRFVVYQR